MKFRPGIFLFVILSGLCFPVFAQRDTVSLNTVITKTNRVAESVPIEKVYLHFDKPYYAVGDTMWYKAYLTAGLHEFSPLSKVLYVDVVSSRDSLVQTFMLPVKNGIATGSVALVPNLYKQDSYHIKAYTKWMANFDAAYFFNKTISVGNAVSKSYSTAITFKRSGGTGAPQISAAITFRDAEGSPATNKKVNWTITAAGIDIAKGKESTDQNGVMNISFVNAKSADLTDATLNTSFDAGKGRTYDQTFLMRSVAAPADMQFFPEGGSLVNGVRSRVAVKAIRSNGLGIGYSAVVKDNTGTEVASFTAQHAGMGVFALTPQTGRTYNVAVDFSDGSRGMFELPKSQASGFTLSVNNTDTAKLFLKMTADSAYLKSHLNTIYYVLGKSGQTVCYAAQIALTNASYSAYIPTSKFPTGIVQISLLNSSGQPVSERIVFIRHQDNLPLSLSSDKPAYGRRQKVRLSITAKTAMPAEGGLSLAVTDESKVPADENSGATILSGLLLSSDLKGYIEAPNYYFNQVNEKTTADLDLLMLTQGYRRFTYQEILTNKLPPIFYMPEQGIELSGTLRTLNGLPFKKGAVTLQIPNKYFTTRTVTDAEGKFKFSDLAFVDSAQVIVNAKSNYNARNLMVMMDGAAYPAIGKNPDYPEERYNIDTMMTAYLQNMKKIYENSRVLSEVQIKVKAPAKKMASHQDYPALSGLGSMSDHQIDGDRLKGCNNVITCLQTMAFGVTFENANFYVTRDFNAGRKVPMAVFVKGMPVDVAYLNSMNAADIESVEIFLKDDLGLVNLANQTNGVLVINTKTAPVGTKVSLQELQDLLPQPSVVKISPKGYTIAKEFYSPKYAVGNNAFGPDLRTTIYWNPKLTTDATGKTFVEFYTADTKGTYRAVIEGMDGNGRIGRAVYRFKLE